MYYHIATGVGKIKSTWRKYALGLSGFGTAAVFGLSALGVSAAPISSSPLVCFSGTSDGGSFNGTCTLSSDGTSAVVNTNDNDTNPDNAYGGVYYTTTSLSGETVGQVDKLSFDYNGTGASGGSPRFSVPIDEDANGTTEGYLFVDTLGCNDGDPNVGTLDVVTDPTCTINYDGESFVNYAAFVAAHPTYKIASDSADDVPFVIVDQPGEFTLSNVQIGSQVSRKDQCKNGGYANMTDANGNNYKNQGQCISDANHHNGIGQDDIRVKND